MEIVCFAKQLLASQGLSSMELVTGNLKERDYLGDVGMDGRMI
jgi:hypothetical protein